MKVPGIDFNGKFLAASPTGVHRVAHELIKALGAQSGGSIGGSELRVMAPRNIRRRPDYHGIPVSVGGMFTGQPWEQFSLPNQSRGRLLVSLCNLAPMAKSNAVTMIHDAQVFLTPGSYSRAFRTFYQLALPVIGRRNRLILTPSAYSRAQLVRVGVAPEAKIRVIPNGVDHMDKARADPAIVRTLALRKGRFVVALANLQAHKNIALLLRCFADPALRETMLVLVGKETRLSFGAAGLAVPPNVVFAGNVTDEQLRGLMENAGCLAFPSRTEGFGLPPLEAMRVSCPAVISPCGALPEVCAEAALRAGPDDVAAWIEAMRLLCNETQKREEMVYKGLRRASEFTWSRAATLLESAIAEVSPCPAGAASGWPARRERTT